MKKLYNYFLLLIFTITLLHAQNSSPKDISEKQDATTSTSTENNTNSHIQNNLSENLSEEQNEAIEALLDDALTKNSTDNSSTADKTTNRDEITDNADKTNEKVTILKSDSFTPPPAFTNKPFEKETPKPNIKKFNKNPVLAASLSMIPGLGHVYLGDYSTAVYIFGTSIIGIGGFLNKHTTFPGSITFGAAMNYGIYSAYRDARLSIKDLGYTYKMPTDSFKELSLAAFNWKVLKKTEVWGGFLGFFSALFTLGYLEEKLSPTKKEEPSTSKIQCKIAAEDVHPLMAFVVGVSEESLFRGFVQPFLSETYTPIGGIILSSLAFGAAHIPNVSDLSKKERKNYYIYSLPFITAFGAYAGWMTYKNQSLQESIALHSWYDFTLFALERVVAHSAMMKKPGFTFSFSF